MADEKVDRECEHCSHPFGEHVLVAIDGNPRHGGYMYCPQCDCTATWDVKIP